MPDSILPDTGTSSTARPTDPAGVPAQREPRQERGQRRVDEILDAAEAVLEELGPSASSIQEIARRAGASVGSIYHFFPNKEAIFQALRARYDSAVLDMSQAIIAASKDAADIDLHVLVTRLIAPFGEFLERSPSVFTVNALVTGSHLKKKDSTHLAMQEAMLVTLSQRWPGVSPADARRRVAVMMSLGDGVANLLVHADRAERRQLIAELMRAIYGYLSTFETRVSGEIV